MKLNNTVNTIIKHGAVQGAWNNLKFNTGDAIGSAIKTYRWHIGGKGEVSYVSQCAYKSILVHAAKQLFYSTYENELKNILPRYDRLLANTHLKKIRDTQASNRQKLIERGNEITREYGKLTFPDTEDVYIAKNKYGEAISDALILSYAGDKPITYLFNRQVSVMDSVDAQKITTKTVFCVDLVPTVKVSSTKNVVFTTVQGRDYSRKELISGGDLQYSVSGNIVSDYEGVYPIEEVKRFVSIMQRGDIISVNHLTFGMLGVDKIVIKDFSLDTPTFKNIQPYSFTCVAVEPDEAMELKNTTPIATSQIVVSPTPTWISTILEDKRVKAGLDYVTKKTGLAKYIEPDQSI